MANYNEIHEFAEKWINKFRDQKINYIELVDHYFADDCERLGFEMDCGKAFDRKYGAFGSSEALDRVVDEITDIPLLGSALYSKWRYFNHWAYDAAEILRPENRAWFILALSRIALLTGDNPFVFNGNLKEMKIISNNICYGPEPQLEDEVEQHIYIRNDGFVSVSRYIYGNGIRNHSCSSKEELHLSESDTKEILTKISSYFSEGYDEVFATDIGDWNMVLTNTEGKKFKFSGSLCADFEMEGIDLSDLIREKLDIPDLFVFDGNNKPDVINRIELNYHRVTKIKPGKVPDGATFEMVTWDYSEKLIIDRATETMEHVSQIGSGAKVTNKYEIEGGIESLLDGFDADELFANIVGNPPDVVDSPNETKDYKITVDYKKSPQKILTGTFDKNGLPDDFEEFIESVFDFIRFYGLGEIYDPHAYGKAKRRSNDYIYCSVVFEDGINSYYYLADDDSISIDDFVVVPAGKDNHEAMVKVVNIEYFAEEDAPFPVNKTKHVLRKCTDDDIEHFLSE